MSEHSMPEKLGRYKIVRELGKGAMGVVYEGNCPNIGRRVAIKTARRDVMEASGRADEMMERFLREARAAGTLNHPNIITIYDADEQDDIAYIAMEYLEGGDLGDQLEAKRRFTPEEAVEICATVCEALAVAHDNGIVHRDVKPANILMPTNAPIKVVDFGIARVSDSNLTQEGAMIGTPHYMSPEQFMGQRADGRSDLFSIGIILYEMLTSEKPFAGEALSTVMHNVIKTEPIEPHELNFAVNSCLSRVILKTLAKRPQDRYQDGRQLAAALRESLKENPDPAVTRLGESQGDATATTIAEPSADNAATVVAAGPGPQGTDTAGPSAAEQPGRAGASGPRVDPGASTLAERPSRHRNLPLYISMAAVLLVLAAGALVIVSGGGGGSEPPAAAPAEPEPGSSSADADAETAAETAAAGPAPAKYFKSARITIIEATNDEAYDLAQQGIIDRDKGCLPGSGTVYLFKPGSDREKPDLEIDVTLGTKAVDFDKPREWTELWASLEGEGIESKFTPDDEGDTAEVLFITLADAGGP